MSTTSAPPGTSEANGQAPFTTQLAAALSLGLGLAWLAWRILFTRGEAPLLVWLALLVVEMLLWLRLALFSYVAWKPEQAPAPPPTTQLRSVDIVITAFHEPLDVIRATLVACRTITYPHTVLLMDDGARPEVRQLADELGARYLSRSDQANTRAGALQAAIGKGRGELVLILEADQVPLPDALHALVGWFDDERIAVVQTPREYSNRDSVLHSDPKRHRDSLINEVVATGRAARDAALWEQPAAMIRRSALDDIGGLVTTGGTTELLTGAALQTAGYRIAFHPTTVVQGLAPYNLDAFRVRETGTTRRRLQALSSRSGPLLKGGRPLRHRLVGAQLLIEDLTGLVRFGSLVILVVTLLTGVAPLSVSVAEIALLWLPWAVTGTYAARSLSRGHLGEREVLLRDLVVLHIQLDAVINVLTRQRGALGAVPRLGTDEGGFDVIDQLRTVAIMTLVVEFVLILRMADALIGWPLPPMDGLALIGAICAAGWFLWHALIILGIFVRRRQHRVAYRVGVDHPAWGDDEIVRIRDLTWRGAAFVATRARRPGDKIHLSIRLPDMSGHEHDLTLRGVIRSCTPNQAGTRHRMGCEFIDVPPAARDVLMEYCAVVRPFQTLRSAG